MSSKESQIIKGVAITLMLFLHLFNKLPASYIPLCDIGDMPLAYLLTRAANPVPFFLIVSGYGLHYIGRTRGLTFGNQLKRVGRLYVQLWLVLTLFVVPLHFLSAKPFLTDAHTLLLNYSCLDPTYNHTLWFLFPYVLLSLSAPFVFRALKCFGLKRSVVVSFLLSMAAAFLISRYYDGFFEHHPLPYQIVLYAFLLFPFLLGASFEHIVSQSSGDPLHPLKVRSGLLSLLLLLGLILLRCTTEHSFINAPYAACFILLFLCIRRPGWMDTALEHLGNYSMMMWMVHKFLFEDILTQPLYDLQYAPAIFAAGLILTYCCAIAIQWMGNHLVAAIPFLRK